MPMTPTDALLRSLESDLVHFHVMRMAYRQGELMMQLRAERAKADPDADVIAAIKAAMLQAERDKRDDSITDREVLEPLREALRQQAAEAGSDSRLATGGTAAG